MYFVVRVIIFNFQYSVTLLNLIDCLVEDGRAFIHRKDNESVCFDYLPSQKAIEGNSSNWAHNTTQYWESKGFNAVRAPKTDDY